MQLRRRWLRLASYLLILAASGGVMVLAASYLYLAPKLPPTDELRRVELQIPLRVFASDGSLIGEFGEKRRTPVSFGQLPPTFIDAVLAAEDERFYRHSGVDMVGLARAFVELVRYQEIRSGGSTITMQVARNFFLSREQKFLRKFNEIVLALQIENLLTKEEILTLYLNKIYLGHRSYGAEAAARVYYGKSIDELSLAQWAMIAGLPKAPSAYNPITNPERAESRRNWILGRMHEAGFISEAAMRAAREEPVVASYHGPTPDLEASYFAEMVRQEMIERLGEDIYTRGIRVYTTLDAGKQRAAVTALRSGLHEYDERHGWRGPEANLEVDVLPALKPAVDQSEEAPDAAADGEAPAPENTDAAEAWATLLRDYNQVGELRPALVARLEEQSALLVLPDASLITLEWPQMEWAKPWVNTNVVGEAPQSAADILAPGDVVRLRPVTDPESGERHWRLAQIPEAQGALVSLDPHSGAVLALQGGYSYRLSKYNRATQSQRQVGSAFKPFIYSAALEHGLTPATLINDAPIVFEDEELETAWRPTGAGSRFYGPTRLRQALYRSLNLVSIRVLQRIGIGDALDTLKRLGLPVDRFPRDLSLALGSATVTPMEVATGYCIFANGGYRVEPWFIQRVTDDAGNLLWEAPPVVLCDAECEAKKQALEQTESAEQEEDEGSVEPRKPPRVLDARIAWLMDSMLKDVIRQGTGRRARALGRDDIAGKTGTTNDQVDAWFSGYHPDLVATTWVGFDTPATLGRGEYGGRAALPVWIEYMGGALAGVPEKPRTQPPGLVSVRINPETGKRAAPGTPDAIFEYFREDNVPEMEADRGDNGNQDQVTPEQLF